MLWHEKLKINFNNWCLTQIQVKHSCSKKKIQENYLSPNHDMLRIAFTEKKEGVDIDKDFVEEKWVQSI